MKKVTPRIEVWQRVSPTLEMKVVINPSSSEILFSCQTVTLRKGELSQVLTNMENLIKEIRIADGRLAGYEIALEATDRELDNVRFKDTLTRAIGGSSVSREAETGS